MWVISPHEVSTPATSPRRGAANALGGSIIIPGDRVEVTVTTVAKQLACSWRRLWAGGLNEIEGGNIAHACFWLLLPCRRPQMPCKDGIFSNSQILWILVKCWNHLKNWKSGSKTWKKVQRLTYCVYMHYVDNIYNSFYNGQSAGF